MPSFGCDTGSSSKRCRSACGSSDFIVITTDDAMCVILEIKKGGRKVAPPTPLECKRY